MGLAVDGDGRESGTLAHDQPPLFPSAASALQPADRPESDRRGSIGRAIPVLLFRGFLASKFPCAHWLRLRRAAPLRFNKLHTLPGLNGRLMAVGALAGVKLFRCKGT